MGQLRLDHFGVPDALTVGDAPPCLVIAGSVGPPHIFPDPFPVRDHEAVLVQGALLVFDPAHTALQFRPLITVAILFCLFPLDPVPLELLAQALAVVLQVLVVADLQASQIWGWGRGTTVPQSATIWDLNIRCYSSKVYLTCSGMPC